MEDNNSGGESTEDRGFGEVAEREIPQDANNSEDTQDEQQVENKAGESSENGSEQTDNQEGSEDGKQEEGTENDSQEPGKTEKGTKIDPNPKSAIHQQFANERRAREQRDQVLGDPKLLARFVKDQYGIDMPIPGAQPQGEQTQTTVPSASKKWTAKDFESLDDVADKFNSLQEQFTTEISKRDEEIKKLNGHLGGLSERGRILGIADTIESDVTSLRSIAELNPKSADFIPGLEDEIGALYHKLDFDENSGMYRGNYSMREIGEAIINTARTAKKAGSKQAQTIVRDKTGGKVRTTPGQTGTVNTDNMSASKSIATGIAKMFGN